MQTYRLTVGPDGQITVPNTSPGQTVTVQVEAIPETDRLTLATATTPEETAMVIERILETAARLRERLKDELPIDQNDLYDEDGLPA